MQYRTSRQHVVDACRTLLERGYLKATEGNVSVRIPGRSLYAVTPSNYGYERMRAEDVCIVDFAGRPVPDDAVTGLVPSIECGLHANVYRSRPDVNAIVHTHQPYASALAFLRKEIPALTDEQVRFLGKRVAIVDYAPSGTGFLARNVEKKVAGGDNAFIIANHGVVALGTDPERAVFNMALLEKVSIAYLLALTTESGKVYTIPTAVREIAFRKLRQDEKRIAAQITAAVPPARADERVPPPSADGTAAELAAGPSAGVEVFHRPGDEPARLGFAISEYPDVGDTRRRLEALAAQPARGLRHDALLDVLAYYENKCAASREIAERAKIRTPRGGAPQLALDYPFPLAIRRAEGAYLTDHDGNAYVDLLQAGGATILGSDYAPVKEKVSAVIAESGPVPGVFHEYELQLAEIVHRLLPHVETYRSVGSGPEAVRLAGRAARAFTGHRMVTKVGETAAHDLGRLKRRLVANRARGGTAAVIVEPLGPGSGALPVARDYNAGVRGLCDEFGALLVFDEVGTGFRAGLGGAAGYFGVTPDLTVFGNAVGGGYGTAGGVGGRADVLAVLGSRRDRTRRGKRGIGRTLPADPLACAAGYFAIEEMARTNAPVIAGRAGDRLTHGLRRLLDRYGLPYVAYNQGSIVHLECSGAMLLGQRNPVRRPNEKRARTRLTEQLGAACAAHGIIAPAGSPMYTSMADTDAVIDDALDRFDQVFQLVEGV